MGECVRELENILVKETLTHLLHNNTWMGFAVDLLFVIVEIIILIVFDFVDLVVVVVAVVSRLIVGLPDSKVS